MKMQVCVRHLHLEEDDVVEESTERSPGPTRGMLLLKPHLLSKGSTAAPPQMSCDVSLPSLTMPRILALSVAKKKDRLADRKGAFEHLHPLQILSHTAKAAVQAVQKLVEPKLVPDASGNPPDIVHILSSIDWEAEAPGIFRKCRLFLLKTLAQLSLQRWLEHEAVVRLGERIAGKLLKNPVPSAVRKAAKLGRVDAAKAMVVTGAVATLLPYATYILTDWCLIAYEEWCAQRDRASTTKNRKQATDDAANTRGASSSSSSSSSSSPSLVSAALPKLLANGKNNLKGWGLGVVGGAVGTLVWPGTGTMIGQLVPEIAIELAK